MLGDGIPVTDTVGCYRMSKQEPEDFRNPPIWIHASEAGKWLLTRREAKRRAVLAILDRVPAPVPAKPLSSPKAARRSRS